MTRLRLSRGPGRDENTIMVRSLAVSAALAAFTLQSQAPPSTITPPTSPFAGALIRRAGEGTPVTMTFAWPAGMTATIDAERSKTTITPAGRKEESGALRYRMRVTAHKLGRLIEYDKFEPLGVTASASEMDSIDRLLNSLMPSIIVSETGSFVKIGDLTKIRATMTKVLDLMKKQAPNGEIPPNLKAMLDNLTSEKVLTQLAQAEWFALAGAYAGYSGTIGRMKEFDSKEPVAVLPGLMVPMRTTFGAKQRGPCQFRGAGEDCVVMQMKSVVAPGGLDAILAKVLEGVKGLEGLKYEHMDVTSDVQSTLEPDTLRPHQVTRTKTVEFIMSMPGMGRVPGSVVEKHSYRITY